MSHNKMEKHYSQVFHKLQYQNIRPQQLALIEQERAYIQKLKMQRMKIQQLTSKYQVLEKNFMSREMEYRKLQQILIEKQRKIQSLIITSEEDRFKYENSIKIIQKNYKMEREKVSKQLMGYREEKENIGLRAKQKELQISQMRVQMERKIEEMREEHKWELKQLAYDYENRYENNSKTKLLQKQLEEYRKLVQRQNKALKAQDEECEILVSMNSKLEQEMRQFCEGRDNERKQKQEYESIISRLQNTIKELRNEIERQNKEYSCHNVIEEYRRKMGKEAKEQIHRIEQLMSEVN